MRVGHQNEVRPEKVLSLPSCHDFHMDDLVLPRHPSDYFGGFIASRYPRGYVPRHDLRSVKRILLHLEIEGNDVHSHIPGEEMEGRTPPGISSTEVGGVTSSIWDAISHALRSEKKVF